jgi:hypothetical protein
MTDPTMRENQERVRRFARALRIALYDVQQETEAAGERAEGPGSRYFYDADVTMRMIVGFEHLRSTIVPPTQEQDLVRSLLSCGYLGTMVLLPPHAWELDDAVRREADLRQESDANFFRERAKEYIESKGIADYLTNLSNDLKANVPADEVLRKFADIAAEAFMALESVNGTWPQRLHRHTQMNVLRFESSGWNVPELLDSPAGDRLRKSLVAVRNQSLDTREAALLNSLRDAASLAALHEMISHPDRFGRVRFYTESSTLWTMLDKGPRDDHEAVRDLLSYPPAENQLAGLFDADCRCVFRDAQYYVVRARFPAVRFPDTTVRRGSRDMTFDELSRVAEELERLLGASSAERQLMSVPLEGKPLSDIIEELESLSFVGTIWQKYAPPPILKIYLAEWTNVWDFVRREPTVELLDKQIGNVGIEFNDRLDLLTSWSKDLDIIRKAVRTLRRICGDSPMPEPMRDLGLVRWGANLDKKHGDRLSSMIGELLDPALATAEHSTQRIASWLHRTYLSGQNAIVVCAILWLLGCYELILRAVEKFAATAEAADAVTLRIIAAAAAVRGSLIKPTEVAGTLTVIKEIVEKRPDEEQSRYLLGLAYVHFWACENSGDTDVTREWLQESFDYAGEAVKRLQKNSMSWTFAVNHCVYVGYLGGLIDEARPHRDRLIQLRKSPHWHYRFADTLAKTFLVVAAQQLADLDSGKKAPTAAMLSLIEKELSRAAKYLDMAKPTYGDDEVDTHRDEMDDLQLKVARYQVDLSAAPALGAAAPSPSTAR